MTRISYEDAGAQKTPNFTFPTQPVEIAAEKTPFDLATGLSHQDLISRFEQRKDHLRQVKTSDSLNSLLFIYILLLLRSKIVIR